MKTVSARKMRGQIGAILEEAESGETLVIKGHGREVAKLGPTDAEKEGLPGMESFRKGIHFKGHTLSQDSVDARMQERF